MLQVKGDSCPPLKRPEAVEDDEHTGAELV